MTRHLSLAISACLAGPACPAIAQDASPAPNGSGDAIAILDQVMVTANKRVESVQTSATTITALSAEDLDRRGWSDFEKYAQFVPGLDFQKAGASQSQLIVRGATVGRVNAAEPQNRSLVGLYLNDIPVDLNGLNPDIDLFDTRVEILKGPQGSLYGDSAMAGAIRYVTSPAETGYASSQFSAGYGSINGGGNVHDAKAMVNVPLKADVLGLRVVGVHRNNYGWTDNVRLDDRDTNTLRTNMWRAALRLAPSERVTGDLMYLHQRTHAGTPPYDTDAPDTDGLGGQAQFSRQTNESIEDQFDLATASIEVGFDRGVLTSVTGYQTREIHNTLVELSEALAANYFGGLEQGQLYHDWDTRRFSQELRFASDLPGRINFTAGVFYSDQHIAYNNIGYQAGVDDFVLATNLWGLAPDRAAYEALGCSEYTDVWMCGPEVNDVRQVAGFGEVYIDVSDALRLTVGGRYYDYKQDFYQDFGGIVNYGRFVKKLSSKVDGFNPKFGASYKLSEERMLYANVAKGYRLGGIGNALPPFCDADIAALGLAREDMETFAPDQLWSYELGSKNTFGNRLSVNGALYFTKWENIQTPINLSCGYIPTGNAGEVRSRGFELQSSLAATPDLQLNLALAFNDSYLVGAAPALSGKDGDRAPYAPRFKGSFGIDWSHEVNGRVRLMSLLDTKYTTRAYDTYDRVNEIPAQFIANARFGAEFDRRYQLLFYIDNLTGEDVVTNVRTRFGLVSRYTGQPRTVGVQFSVHF